MVKKSYTVISAIILFCLVLTVPVDSGWAKSPVRKASHRHSKNTVSEKAPGKLVLRSAAALVEDQQTGEYLVEKQATAVVPIASITKLMTAMVVLDSEINLNESFTIETKDMDTLRHSHSRLPVGSLITRRDALLIALMASDNRAASALGRNYPGGIAAFVAAMNAKAKSLGLAETHFVDSTGLSSGNVSSARDLARLVAAAYQYNLIREFTTSKNALIHNGRRNLAFHNTNRLIQNPRWDIGLSKTGFIGEAGRCLVMQANVAKRPVLIVLLDSQGRLTRVGDANRIKQWLEGPYSQKTRKG